jgi:midasin
MPKDLLLRVVLLLNDIHTHINLEHRFGGAGSPWEFNLRDLLRWCHLLESARSESLSLDCE